MQRITISMFDDTSKTNNNNQGDGEPSLTPLTPQHQQYLSPNQNGCTTPITPNTDTLNNVIESLRQVKIEPATGQGYMDSTNSNLGMSSPIFNWNLGNVLNTQNNSVTIPALANHLFSNMYHQPSHQQNEHVNDIQMDESFNCTSNVNNNTCNSSSSLSYNVNNNNINNEDATNNLLSLFDTHRKILLFDNMVENELSRMNHRSNSISLDNNSLIDLSGKKNSNGNTQNQTQEASIQQLSSNEGGSQISDIFNISQAIQNITSLPTAEQELLSNLIWSALINNSNNSLPNDSSSIQQPSFISQQHNQQATQNINNQEPYRIFESFDDVQPKERPSPMQFSQHVQALTLHQMDDDSSPTTPLSNSGNSTRARFKKFNSHPILNTNGRYSIDNSSNSMMPPNGSSLSSTTTPYSEGMNSAMSHRLSVMSNDINPTMLTASQSNFSNDCTTTMNLSDIVSKSATQQQVIISPKGNFRIFDNNPQLVITPNSVVDVSIINNSQPKPTSSCRRISTCSSTNTTTTLTPPTTCVFEQQSNNQTSSTSFSSISNNPSPETCFKPIAPSPKTSSHNHMNNINFSLPGDSDMAVKQNGKNNQSKKYSNNNFSESAITISAQTSSCVINNSVVGHQLQSSCKENSSTVSQTFHSNNNTQKSLSLQQPLENSKVVAVNQNISSTEDTSVAYSTPTSLLKLPSTTLNNFHNSPSTELCITPTLKSAENNLDITTQQNLNNISTDYTMSSHSPISSSNSNEQNGQNKQYQGVMPLEGNQSNWGVKVNRKYRQLRKSLKTCKHFEDNYFVLELNGQGNPGNPSVGQQPPKPKAKPKAKVQPNAHHEDKKPAIPIPYKEQVNLMGEFSVAKSTEDEVLPLSILNRSEEIDLYLTTPNSTSSASSKSSSAKDLPKKKRKNASQEPTRKNRKKDSEQEISLGGLDSTSYHHDVLPSINMSLNLAPMQTIPPLDNSEIMNFNKVITPDMMSYQTNNNIHHHQQIPSLISSQKPLDYHQPITPTLINYENTPSPSPNINFENQTTLTNQINNQTENRNQFGSGFPSNNSFGLFSTNEDFTTMKLPSNSSIDSFFKADLTDEKPTNMPRNLSSSSDFLPLEETVTHHLPVSNPIVNNHSIHPITTQVKTIPPKIDIVQPKKEIEKNQLTRCMSHASLSMLDEEEEEEHVPVVNNITIPQISSISINENHHLAKEPIIQDIKSKSPLITPLNAVLYKNISVSNMDLVKLDVPSASILRPIQSESEMERDHTHWINEIKTLPSNDSLANMALVDFDMISESKKH